MQFELKIGKWHKNITIKPWKPTRGQLTAFGVLVVMFLIWLAL